jgi:hypothetical protein
LLLLYLEKHFKYRYFCWITQALKDCGIDFKELKQATEKPDADLLDLLCYLAFNALLLTRRERTENLKRERRDFFDQYGTSNFRYIVRKIYDTWSRAVCYPRDIESSTYFELWKCDSKVLIVWRAAKNYVKLLNDYGISCIQLE